MIFTESIEIIELETDRLRLRQWLGEDREPFAEMNADPKVMEFFPVPLTKAESDAIATRCHSLIAQRGWGFWAAELKASNQFIGFIGLHIPIANLPFSPCVEIGWRLARPYWGHGLATEGALRALQVGFEVLEQPEIVSFTSLLNKRSRAVMQRLGMIESKDTFEHPSISDDSPLKRHCLYRLTRQQWLKSNLLNPKAGAHVA